VASVLSALGYGRSRQSSDTLKNQLGCDRETKFKGVIEILLSSERWQRVYNFGARPQRLLWQPGTKESEGTDICTSKGLASPSL